jgi:chemotaxis protein CheD
MIKEKLSVVGMGDISVTSDPRAVLACFGLGSCIALSAYDPVTKTGGLVHIVLPNSDGKAQGATGKFADTAVPLLLSEMSKLGGSRSRLIIKIAGGAQMSLAPGFGSASKTGENNRIAVEAALAKERLKLVAADTGGNKGRTVRLYVDSGKFIVKTAGGEGKEL